MHELNLKQFLLYCINNRINFVHAGTVEVYIIRLTRKQMRKQSIVFNSSRIFSNEHYINITKSYTSIH